MPNYRDEIKVDVRGKKYKFSLKAKAGCPNQARNIAEDACKGMTYRIDVRNKKE